MQTNRSALRLPLGSIRTRRLTLTSRYVRLNIMRAAGLQDSLERLGAAIRDVESELAAMKAEHDPLASHIFCCAPQLSERKRYEKRKTPRDDRPAEFQYCLRAWLSREPGRMGAPHGSSCEAVKFGSFSLATLGGISHDSLMNTPTLSINCVRLLALLLLGCFALLPTAQAVSPPPDGGYPVGNTAEGQNALLSLTSGAYNTAVGLFSLRSITTGRFKHSPWRWSTPCQYCRPQYGDWC